MSDATRVVELLVSAGAVAVVYVIDHVLRRGPLGWPFSATTVTPFSLAVAVVPLVGFGLYLATAGRSGAAVVAVFAAGVALLVGSVRLATVAVATPTAVVADYTSGVVALVTLGLLGVLVVLLVVTTFVSSRVWFRDRTADDVERPPP